MRSARKEEGGKDTGSACPFDGDVWIRSRHQQGSRGTDVPLEGISFEAVRARQFNLNPGLRIGRNRILVMNRILHTINTTQHNTAKQHTLALERYSHYLILQPLLRN